MSRLTDRAALDTLLHGHGADVDFLGAAERCLTDVLLACADESVNVRELYRRAVVRARTEAPEADVDDVLTTETYVLLRSFPARTEVDVFRDEDAAWRVAMGYVDVLKRDPCYKDFVDPGEDDRAKRLDAWNEHASWCVGAAHILDVRPERVR